MHLIPLTPHSLLSPPRLNHFVPLKLLQALATFDAPPPCTYISQLQLDAIKKMSLLNRGRLSVQPVEDLVYDAVVELGTTGGWEELLEKEKKPKAAKRKSGEGGAAGDDDGDAPKAKSKRRKKD